NLKQTYSSKTIQNQNWDIILIIHEIKRTKNITFTLHKIKSRSNALQNQADLLAKRGSNKTILEISHNYINLPTHFLWKDYLIPFKARAFIKNTFTIKELYTWSLLKIFKDLSEIEWTTCFEILNSIAHNPSKYTFRTKILTDNLPTMENLNIRYPYLYPTPN
ncbi:4098_t:CDS:1, partial [Ambispora leptoticha]